MPSSLAIQALMGLRASRVSGRDGMAVRTTISSNVEEARDEFK